MPPSSSPLNEETLIYQLLSPSIPSKKRQWRPGVNRTPPQPSSYPGEVGGLQLSLCVLDNLTPRYREMHKIFFFIMEKRSTSQAISPQNGRQALLFCSQATREETETQQVLQPGPVLTLPAKASRNPI